MKRTVVLSLLLGCLLVVSFPCTAQTDVQSADTVIIDARLVPGAPKALPFPVGGTSPDGHKLYANRRYLIRDGQPWFPIVGEFHYSRCLQDVPMLEFKISKSLAKVFVVDPLELTQTSRLNVKIRTRERKYCPKAALCPNSIGPKYLIAP